MYNDSTQRADNMHDELKKIYDKYGVYGISIYEMDGKLRSRVFNLAPEKACILMLEPVLKFYEGKE